MQQLFRLRLSSLHIAGCISVVLLSACGGNSDEATKPAEPVAALGEAMAAEYALQINDEPLFAQQGKWSDGYKLAKGHGEGVVVGPGAANENVFAQGFATAPGKNYKIVARAASVDDKAATGRLQINWNDKDGNFISVWSETFEVTPEPKTIEKEVVVPSGAAQGVLYVVGDAQSVVRYTEMRLLGQGGQPQ